MSVESVAIFEVPTATNMDPCEYGPPNVPVLVSGTETIRVLLGTVDKEETCKPDLFIERRRNGWMIAIHPNNGDPCAIVYMFDDGGSFLVPEGIQLIEEYRDSVANEIDAIE